MKPTYFDLTVPDVSRAKDFFERVLGWRFEKFDMPHAYHRIQAGSEAEPGIDGGIGAVKDVPLSGENPLTLPTVPAPNLDAVLASDVAAGGAVVEPRTPIPGMGWYATCAEPGGLKFGVIQAAPLAVASR